MYLFTFSKKLINNLFNYIFKYQEDAEKEYGKKTIVLLQIGLFYECYCDITRGCDLKEIGKLLELIVSKRILFQETNTLGFPTQILPKYLDILINNDFTVVLVENKNDPWSSIEQRNVTMISKTKEQPESYSDSDSEIYIDKLVYDGKVQISINI